MDPEIERIYEELNRPSAAKLKLAVKKEGIRFATNEIDTLTRKAPSSSSLRPRLRLRL